MTKPKKEATGELMIPIAEFTRLRESVIMSLTKLQTGLNSVQNSLSSFLEAYIQHSQSVLGGDADAADLLQLPAHLTANVNAALEAGQKATNAVAGSLVGTVLEGGKKKRKREKKDRDPNAPKRPLTAAFLYARHARPYVKKDLEDALGPGEKLEANAVNLEVNRRWNNMTAEEKEEWKASYRASREEFKKEQAAYLASIGGGAPVDVHDDDDEEVSDEAEAGALDSDEASESEDEAAAVVPTPLTKVPSPPAKTTRPNKRQKTVANGTQVPVPIAPAITPIPPPQTQMNPPRSAVEASSPVKKDKKKKAAPQAIAPAPASNKEGSPDDHKKKAKSSRSTRNTEVEEETQVADKENKGIKKRDRSKRKSEGTAA